MNINNIIVKKVSVLNKNTVHYWFNYQEVVIHIYSYSVKNDIDGVVIYLINNIDNI